MTCTHCHTLSTRDFESLLTQAYNDDAFLPLDGRVAALVQTRQQVETIARLLDGSVVLDRVQAQLTAFQHLLTLVRRALAAKEHTP